MSSHCRHTIFIRQKVFVVFLSHAISSLSFFTFAYFFMFVILPTSTERESRAVNNTYRLYNMIDLLCLFQFESHRFHNDMCVCAYEASRRSYRRQCWNCSTSNSISLLNTVTHRRRSISMAIRTQLQTWTKRKANILGMEFWDDKEFEKCRQSRQWKSSTTMMTTVREKSSNCLTTFSFLFLAAFGRMYALSHKIR